MYFNSSEYITLAKLVTVNPDRSMKNEKFRSQLSTYFRRHAGFRSKRAFILRAAEEPKPRKKISKIGFSRMKETLDFSSCQRKKLLE
jgi:hypothetical protein